MNPPELALKRYCGLGLAVALSGASLENPM